jgi:hypothetical protein
MERSIKCSSGCRSVQDNVAITMAESNTPQGPAHAVYFATYEWVKHAMGGNAGLKTDHHPLAAGKISTPCVLQSIHAD